MEEKHRTKYYHIDFKDVNLRTRFKKMGEEKNFRNSDTTLKFLLECGDENKWLEERYNRQQEIIEKFGDMITELKEETEILKIKIKILKNIKKVAET